MTFRSKKKPKTHERAKLDVHLFVRRERKTPNGTGAPFYYCEDLEFVSWEGEKPITLQWKPLNPLPERLAETLNATLKVWKPLLIVEIAQFDFLLRRKQP